MQKYQFYHIRSLIFLENQVSMALLDTTSQSRLIESLRVVQEKNSTKSTEQLSKSTGHLNNTHIHVDQTLPQKNLLSRR